MSLFLTHQLELSPQEYISVVMFQVPSCPLTPFPFFRVPLLAAPWYGADGAMSTFTLCSRPQQQGLTAPGPPPACPLARRLPSASRRSSQRSAQLGLGQMPAFLLGVGPSTLPPFLFPFVYGTRSSFQAMRKCSAAGQLEFVSRKIAQEFRAGAGSQACWAGCFVLSGPGPAGGPAGRSPGQSGVSRMPHGLPGWEEPVQQSPTEVRDRLCKFS